MSAGTVRLNNGHAWHALGADSADHVVTACGREFPRGQCRFGDGEYGCVDCLRAEARDLTADEWAEATRNMALVVSAREPHAATCSYCGSFTRNAAADGWDRDEDGDDRCDVCSRPDEDLDGEDDDYPEDMDGDHESALASVYGEDW